MLRTLFFGRSAVGDELHVVACKPLQAGSVPSLPLLVRSLASRFSSAGTSISGACFLIPCTLGTPLVLCSSAPTQVIAWARSTKYK
jgi:hypothetical protein